MVKFELNTYGIGGHWFYRGPNVENGIENPWFCILDRLDYQNKLNRCWCYKPAWWRQFYVYEHPSIIFKRALDTILFEKIVNEFKSWTFGIEHHSFEDYFLKVISEGPRK